MKKIKDNWKKIIGILSCAFILVGALTFSNTRAFAATGDGSVVGTANLNGTAQNSAVIGNRLTAPEVGWRRYDDPNTLISYPSFSGSYTGHGVNGNYYNSTYTQFTSGDMKFKFKGTKLRIIGLLSNVGVGAYSNKMSITIDSQAPETYSNGGTVTYQALVYEKTGLENTIHTVTITNNYPGAYANIDGIDVDETGSLVDPSAISVTGISLDKTSLDMHPGDPGLITATVTPDNATNKAVSWTTSNSSVVTVDNGNIKAVGEGTAIITATTQDGNYSATCTINVKKADAGNGLLTVTMTDGQQRTYDLSMTQVNDFITWYNGRANGSGTFTYSFNKTPSSGAYSKRTEYLIYDKISNYDVDEYKAN